MSVTINVTAGVNGFVAIRTTADDVTLHVIVGEAVSATVRVSASMSVIVRVTVHETARERSV